MPRGSSNTIERNLGNWSLSDSALSTCSWSSATITEVSAGEYTIKQTTLYSALKRLEAAGLATSYAHTSESGKPRTYYRLTASGGEHLTAKLAEWEDTKTLIDRFIDRFTQGEH